MSENKHFVHYDFDNIKGDPNYKAYEVEFTDKRNGDMNLIYMFAHSTQEALDLLKESESLKDKDIEGLKVNKLETSCSGINIILPSNMKPKEISLK